MKYRIASWCSLFAGFLAFLPSAAAQELCRSTVGGHCVNLAAAGIPGLEFLQNVETPGELFSKLYTYSVSIVALMAFLVFTYGAVRYMTALEGEVSKAKELMKSALFGLVLALTSYLILNIINPNLVKNADISLPKIEIKNTSQSAGETSLWRCPSPAGGGSNFPSKDVCQITCGDFECVKQ